MILLALCLIQASAYPYYFKIKYYEENGSLRSWSSYIKVGEAENGVYPNGLRKLLNGEEVKDENNVGYKLPKKANSNVVDTCKIYGIVFANEKGRNKGEGLNILPGDEYEAWKKICPYIKYLELREYKLDSYNNSGYFMGMSNLEELELPKYGMKVGDDVKDGELYFANADKLEKIYLYKEGAPNDKVEITNEAVKDSTLLNRVGKKMFANCFSLSTKYINRLIKNVTEIKDSAFYADEGNRDKFSDLVAGHNMAIEIPSSVTKIGDHAFYNRVKVTGLNIQGNGSLEIGSEAFGQCDELATIQMQTQDNKELKIYKNAFMRCKQLNALNLNNARITYLGTGVFGDCRSMTSKFVDDVLTNYAANGGTKIPAYLFFGCNGQDGHDGTVANKK